jgi:hypothetical protein
VCIVGPQLKKEKKEREKERKKEEIKKFIPITRRRSFQREVQTFFRG